MKRFSDFPNSSVCFLKKQTCYKLSLQNKARVTIHLLPHILAHRDGYSQENRILVPRDSQCFIQKGHQARPHLIPAFPKFWVTAAKTWWMQPGSQEAAILSPPIPCKQWQLCPPAIRSRTPGPWLLFPLLISGSQVPCKRRKPRKLVGREREKPKPHKGLAHSQQLPHEEVPPWEEQAAFPARCSYGFT